MMKLPLEKERIPVKQILIYGFLPSFLKKIIYRIKGYKIGSNVHIGFGSIITAEIVRIGNNVDIGFLNIIRSKKIEIGECSSIASFCYINTERLKIGKDTVIREQVSVNGLKTPESGLTIGDRCLVGQSVILDTTMPIIIGNDCGIGGRSLLFTHSSRLSRLDGFPVKFGSIKMGNNVWISWNSFIRSGVEIGDNVVVQPNVEVFKSIPSNSIFIGRENRIVPNFFYKPVPKEKKGEVIKNILNDFVKYIEYEGIKGIKQNGTVSCRIGNLNYRIIIQEDKEVELHPGDCNILLKVNGINEIKGELKDSDMILAFEEKTRHGSNLLGEELVNFFSRYGIRFIRTETNINIYPPSN
jgi:maltose O-acetyltransferase